MEKSVLRQRELVNEVLSRLEEIRALNRDIEPDLKTDVICLIGQHRHTFEEQKVVNHDNCICVHFTTGTFAGNCGNMGMFAATNPEAKRMIQMVASKIR